MKLLALLKELLHSSSDEARESDEEKMAATFEALIAGLGNPGVKYAMTKHNIGFIIADALAQKLSAPFDGHKFDAEFAFAEHKSKRLIIAKPQTYMNNSGIAVRGVATFFKIQPENIIVIHDDVDLEPGRLIIRKGGSDGGHKGIKSVTEALGTAEYIRLRVGVGRPEVGDVTDYVLKPFSNEEVKFFGDEVVERVAQAALDVVASGYVKAQNKFHSKRGANDKNANNKEEDKEEKK
ncbi:MAG: aminoacyl-tRNA hydrolase [Myxococcota bacterium]